MYAWKIGKEFAGLFDRHIQYVGDGFSLVSYLESFAVIPFALAGVALYVNIGQEVHLDFFRAGTLTGFTPPSFHVEAEASWLVAPNLSLG